MKTKRQKKVRADLHLRAQGTMSFILGLKMLLLYVSIQSLDASFRRAIFSVLLFLTLKVTSFYAQVSYQMMAKDKRLLRCCYKSQNSSQRFLLTWKQTITINKSLPIVAWSFATLLLFTTNSSCVKHSLYYVLIHFFQTNVNHFAS